MFNVNDEVIVSENIFPESTDLNDIKFRGQRGLVALRMWEVMNNPAGEWDGCYQVDLIDGDFVYVNENEIWLVP